MQGEKNTQRQEVESKIHRAMKAMSSHLDHKEKSD